jgi:hypothetical protein
MTMHKLMTVLTEKLIMQSFIITIIPLNIVHLSCHSHESQRQPPIFPLIN